MAEKNEEIRTRFAPSPTGFLHIGGLRTALYSYALAKSQKGKFVLRIEDTDRKRFVPGTTEKIYELLKLFGLEWDEGPLIGGPYEPYIQSERASLGIYRRYAERLVKENHAYYCFHEVQTKEEVEEEQAEKKIRVRDECRLLTPKEVEEKLKTNPNPAIRLRVPDNEKVSYQDFVINKEIAWETKYVDEAMLLKSDGFPTYHLAVVVDDALMKISHILRGHDWLPSTPIHLLLYQYLNFPIPQIGHLTDILDPEGGKLSKRKGSVSCEEFLNEGYLPEALLNFIMLLGWAPKNNQEIFSLLEFVESFPQGNLQIANPVFNRKKLDWFNGIYLRKKNDEELLRLIKPFAPEGADGYLLAKTVPLVKERMNKLADYQTLANFFFNEPEINESFFNERAEEQLKKAYDLLAQTTNWQKEEVERKLKELVAAESWQTGDFFMNFRAAITGSLVTPPITDSIILLGREKTLARLEKVIYKL